MRANRLFNVGVAFLLIVFGIGLAWGIAKHSAESKAAKEREDARVIAIQSGAANPARDAPPKVKVQANMPSTAATIVGSGSDGTGTWNNPNNITSEDGSTSDVFLPSGNAVPILGQMAGNAFSIPAGYKPVSVLVEVKASGNDIFGGTITYSKVQLNVGGVDVGADAATGSPASSLTWDGFTINVDGLLSLSDANSATFGVYIAFSDSGGGPGQAHIDAVRLTVTYQLDDVVVIVVPGIFSVPAGEFSRSTSGAVIFRAGFADTPVPTPLNPHPLAAGLSQGSEILAAETFAGSVRYAKGFEDSLPVVAPPPVIAGRADQDLWQTTLLGGAALARYSVPFDPLPAVPPSTVQVVGFAPGLGLPFDAADGRLAIFRGTVPPETPASQLLPPHIVGLGPSDDLPAGHFEGGVIFGRGWFEAPTPTFCPPPPHIVAWPLGVELLVAWRGAAITAHGFDDAFPQRPPPPAVVGWPQRTELEALNRGAVLAGHGFSDASPVLPIRPVVLGQQDGQLALLAAGQAISFQTDVTPQPAPPTPACVVAQPPAADLGPLLAGWQGVALSAKGFAGAQPFSPQPSFIVAAAPDFESLQGQLAGSSISARGFARAEPALSPITAVLASEPPPTSLFAGDVLHIVGDEPKPDFPPVRTVYAAAPWCEEFLQPAGAVLAARGFRGAQPDSPTPSVVAAETVGAALQAQLGSGAVLSGRGFARAEPARLALPMIVAAEAPPLDRLAGSIIAHQPLFEAEAPAIASRGYLVSTEPPDLDQLTGRLAVSVPAGADQRASVTPNTRLSFADESPPWRAMGEGRAIVNRMASVAPVPECSC